MDLLFKVSRMNVKSLILIIEWVGYSFAKHVISHCFIMVNLLFRETKCRSMCFRDVLW
jgi:hypothetical protein